MYKSDHTSYRTKGQNKSSYKKSRSSKSRKGINNSLLVDPAEYPNFMLYCEFAITNIRNFFPKNSRNTYDENKVRKIIDNLGSQEKKELANFLWLFKFDEPSRDFKDYNSYTKLIVEKIFQIRNFFAHNGKESSLETLRKTNEDLYILIEGLLLPNAYSSVVLPGVRTDKLFKAVLVSKKKQGAWEFSLNGFIFLVSLALYSDEAMQFVSSFNSLKISSDVYYNENGEACYDNIKKSASKRALRSLLTYYSIRKGRSLSSKKDSELTPVEYSELVFADILGYLNKVPAISYDYLKLVSENERLKEKRNASTESEENKKNKYELHKRFKDRFIVFATKYIEDKNILPCIHFKRLDSSTDIEGRKKYKFGFDQASKDGVNHKFKIYNDGIGFDYIPTEHYGDIKISHMRSMFSSNMLQHLLLLSFRGINVNEIVNNYFSAYHEIIERMLNAEKIDDISLKNEAYVDAISRLTFVEKSKINAENIENILTPYFAPSIYRYFIPNEMLVPFDERKKRLIARLDYLSQKAKTFEENYNAFEKWFNLPQETREPFPREKRIDDLRMINRVFDLFNLYLPAENKFRQLPRGEQHNGTADFTYQLAHKNIGNFAKIQLKKKFTKDKKKIDFFYLMENLNSVGKILKEKILDELKSRYNELLRERARKSHSLDLLALAATQLYISRIDYYKNRLENDSKLEDVFKKFKIKSGRELNKDALISSILHIDISKWQNAYNYETQNRYVARELSNDDNLIAPAVSFPNCFIKEYVKSNPSLINKKFGISEDNVFDFNTIFKDLYDNKYKKLLRAYYDISPIMAFISKGECNPIEKDLRGYSKSHLSSVVSKIKKVRNQDIILYEILQSYNEDIMGKASNMSNRPIVDIYETPMSKELKGNIKITYWRSDSARPLFDYICDKAKNIVEASRQKNKKEWSYYELVEEHKFVKSNDIKYALELLPLLLSMENRNKQSLDYNNMTKEDILDKEYRIYQGIYPNLTKDKYTYIVEVRNSICHNKEIGMDYNKFERVKKILHECCNIY